MNTHRSTPRGFSTRHAVLSVVVAALPGCASLRPGTAEAPNAFTALRFDPSDAQLSSSIHKDKLTNATRQLAAEGIKALDQLQFKKASDLFNLALKTDLSNSYLHFLNSLAYQYRALEGETALLALAEQGYEMAVQFDPSNWLARHYRGLLHLDRREYRQAQLCLMEAALYKKDDPELLYDLAVASYYSKDPKTAYAALQGLNQIEPGQPRTLRGLAIVAASAGDKQQAAGFLEQLQGSGAGKGESDFVAQRVGAWRDTYQSGMVLAQFSNQPQPIQPPPMQQQPWQQQQQQQYQQPGMPQFGRPGTGLPGVPGFGMQGTPGMPGAPRNPGDFVEKQMVMVDVVIISSEEDNGNTMGVNLLEGLRVQFGNSAGTAAWSKTFNQTSDLINSAASTSSRTITRLIGLSGVSYTLNIANAAERSNEVLARPTLLALGGQTSQFFSGVDVVGAAVSGGQGSSVQVQKEVGVKLAVTPEFLPDNLIRLQVLAERTFLTNPNSNVVFDFRLDTTKTIVSANVAMRFGETIILSGLSERDKGVDNSGVPLLRDVPLVQYLFSRNARRDYQKSVLILLTPRRPQYTNRPEESVSEERSKFSDSDRIQAEFEDKYRLWYKLIPTTAYVVHSLTDSTLFREFRSGDLDMPTWISRKSHAGRIRSALGFLFF